MPVLYVVTASKHAMYYEVYTRHAHYISKLDIAQAILVIIRTNHSLHSASMWCNSIYAQVARVDSPCPHYNWWGMN